MRSKQQGPVKVVSYVVKGIEEVSSFLFKLCQVGIFLLTVVIFVSVVMRYTFNHPIHWTNEVSEYILIFIVFMGSAELMKKGEHIRADFFVRKLHGKQLKILVLFILLSSLFWCAMIDWFAWQNVLNAYKYGMTSPSLLRFPIYIPYSFIFVGLAMLFFQLLILFIRGIIKSATLYEGGED